MVEYGHLLIGLSPLTGLMVRVSASFGVLLMSISSGWLPDPKVVKQRGPAFNKTQKRAHANVRYWIKPHGVCRAANVH